MNDDKETATPRPTPNPRLQLPPRAEIAADARAKMERGETLTLQEQRLLVLALPRKVRRKHGIRTTPIRAEINAIRAMSEGAEGPRTGYTGNTAQHQQRYDANQRKNAARAARKAARAARKAASA